jgi:hypothetical protein
MLSRTREVLPCDGELGIHPGEPSCLRAALASARKGFPALVVMYGGLYGIQALTGRIKSLR